ncbi:MAG: Bax inhibitor-1/YccA family protein [Flavobacteriales bacterium]|nr:Bax inhibitor-1/YccA family protein [Flavobacteriales bacterium]HRE95217.1 Bax inhibitor-1/YccA family protein [Flavobacteriales bacterium]HRJ35150.1 Bax inhibitor-1/YccA family protein [Flavobacteriales bacterium]HRJ38657.1 Bax inhibitor-1/YccA family protein [Flavobacteriales bacterium]
MSNNMFNTSTNVGSGGSSSFSGVIPRTFVANVFSYMLAALAITGVVAYAIGSNLELFVRLFISETGRPNPLFWIVSFAPLGLVLLMNFAFNRLSAPVLLGVFILYAGMMGLSLSSIFIMYTTGSIAAVFFITAGTFGVMAFLGYTTKTDLTKFGSILMMGLIGIIIASIVNIFMQSSGLEWLISIIGVLVFTGLTAYDMQKIKEMGEQVGSGHELASKMAIMAGLTLYLDFINLFIMLLRLLGNRNE